MTLGAYNFTQPINENYYRRVYSENKPDFSVQNIYDECAVIPVGINRSTFTPGNHFRLHHCHCKHIPDSLDLAVEFLNRVEWDIKFYETILSKIPLDAAHIVAIQILTKEIQKDQELQKRTLDKIKILSNP